MITRFLWFLSIAIVLGSFAYPSAVKADSVYSVCDNVDAILGTSGGFEAWCANFGSYDDDTSRTIYGIATYIDTIPTATDLYIKVENADSGATISCQEYTGTRPSGSGVFIWEFDTPVLLPTGIQFPIIRFRDDSGCTSGMDGIVSGYTVSSGLSTTNIYQYWYFEPPVIIPPDTTTHIETVTPEDASIQATSTSFTFGATGYVNEDDFTDNMKLKLRYSNGGFESTQLVGPSFALLQQPDSTGEIEWEITESGEFSFSTTTDIQIIGNYDMDTRITAPRFNLFGWGFLERELDTEHTYFIVSTSTAFGTLRDDVLRELDVFAGTASSTINTSVCNPISGNFSIVPCVQILFVPDSNQLKNLLQGVHDTILVKFPWGYATRLAVIFSNNATTTPLTSFTVSFNTGPGSDMTPAYETLDFDMDDMVSGGAALLDTVEDTRGYGVSVRDVTEPFVQLFIGLSILIIIWHDIMAMGHNRNRPGRRK